MRHLISTGKKEKFQNYGAKMLSRALCGKLTWFCPRGLKVRLVLATLVCVCVVGSVAFWVTVVHSSLALLKECRDESSTVYLNNLCTDYLNGLVTGSLCEPLCVTREVEFVRCLGHGVKLHVLEARWGANTVVLKTSKELDHPLISSHLDRSDKFTRIITKQEFIREANQTVFLNLAGRIHVPSTLAAVERVFSECDVLDDDQLSYHEALVCWQLVETDEFILLSVLSGVSAIPDLYGSCGTMYAMQYATSDPFLSRYLPTVADDRSWEFRARLAISLIEMVRSIEVTPYGTLYLCDVQESNFGVVRRLDTGDLVAKTIDLDIAFFERTLNSSLAFEKNNECHSHRDCDMVSCQVACNMTSHTCSGQLWSNNLQVICGRFFAQIGRRFGGDQSHSVVYSGLLRDPPPRLEEELQLVLEQCTSSLHPNPHINITVITHLLHLLHSSLDTEQLSAPPDGGV